MAWIFAYGERNFVLDKTADGKIEFPYDAVHVDFLLKAA